MDKTAAPFRIDIAPKVIADLNERLRQTRWPDDPDNVDGGYGVRLSYLSELARFWSQNFDWYAVQARINSLPQYKVEISGQPIHFMHLKGNGKNPLPLILSHGWPWTFWDTFAVAHALANPTLSGGDAGDAFDVIVPSLPGFGFSTPSMLPKISYGLTASLWHELMTKILGHRKFGAAGGDWGAMVSAELGHRFADDVCGIHLTQPLPPGGFKGDRPWDITGGRRISADLPAKDQAEIAAYQRKYAAHVAVQTLEPQTLAYAMHDSPTGMLAWLLQRWQGWSGRTNSGEPGLSREQMLTNATIFWVTESFGSSARWYANAARTGWSPAHDCSPLVQVPSGFTFLSGDMPPGITVENRIETFRASRTGKLFNIHHAKAHVAGGHFAHVENAPAVIDDIRNTFRDLR